jgi:hypothetical protein
LALKKRRELPIMQTRAHVPAAGPISALKNQEVTGMSTDTPSVEPTSGFDPEDHGDPQLAWLRASLRQVMEELMASDATSMQKANAVARLGGLYLKTYKSGELEKQTRALRAQAAALEQRLAAIQDESTQARELVREWRQWWEQYQGEAQCPHEGASLPPLEPALAVHAVTQAGVRQPSQEDGHTADRSHGLPPLIVPIDANDGRGASEPGDDEEEEDW